MTHLEIYEQKGVPPLSLDHPHVYETVPERWDWFTTG